MTNPMTPTEQDEERVDPLKSFVDRWYLPEFEGEDDSKDMLAELQQLITADRKRVALEVEMNAWKQVRKSYPKKQTLQGHAVSKLTLADIDRKITELKSQQEEA